MTRSILKARAKAFIDDQSGNITVEFVLAMPILFWAFMACYVFFDGYRQSAANLKAAYTISDCALICFECPVGACCPGFVAHAKHLSTPGRTT